MKFKVGQKFICTIDKKNKHREIVAINGPELKIKFHEGYFHTYMSRGYSFIKDGIWIPVYEQRRLTFKRTLNAP